MPIRLFFLYYLVFALPGSIRAQIPPLGQWRDHLPYHQALQVAGSATQIWCATPWSIFSIDLADHNIDRYSKVNGLSEAGISRMGLNEAGDQLVIGYNNSLIDILEEKTVHRIDAIKNSSVTGDKTINDIFNYGQQAYLGTGIGIIVIDLGKYEIKDTYIIGNTGNKVRVNGLTVAGSFFYAATEEGLKRAGVTGNNLADFRNWQNVSGINGLTTGAVTAIGVWQQQLVVLKNDSLFLQINNGWQFLYGNEWTIRNINISGGKLLVSEELGGAGRVRVLSAGGVVDELIQNATFTRQPRQAIFAGGHYWIADSLSGLTSYASGQFESFVPNSPYSRAAGPLQILNNTLWIGAGGVTPTWGATGNKDGMYSFRDGSWRNINAGNLPLLDSFPDIVSLAIDAVDESIWAGSYGGGLLQLKTDGKAQIYKQNSPLQAAYFAPGSYRVSGLAFDTEHNLWISNYGALQQVKVRKQDGSWRNFFIPYSIADNGVGPIVIDDVNQKWIMAPNGNGLFCFNHGQTIDNPADDRWKWYRAGRGNGNLPDNQVLSLARDKSGFIWIGTRQGIGIIQCPQEVFTSTGCEALLPVVQQDNFAGYLFSDEQVQSIAVDGADRKWIGTKNGVWLISADGSKTIARFTAANSPLLSDDVQQIGIDGNSGEVYFSTSKGICSYRGEATEGNSSNENVLVFPNPVPPGYTGTIAIRGLTNNGIVKITEMDGRLVYQTRALGGQAVWNGKDYKGRTISTGVYLVLVSDDNKQEKTVTKIVFVSK